MTLNDDDDDDDDSELPLTTNKILIIQTCMFQLIDLQHLPA
jgi:hypothetical protein